MYFDNRSPVEELRKYDNFKDDTVPAEDFERVIQDFVPSIDKEKNEVSQLTLVCPHIEEHLMDTLLGLNKNRRSSEKKK